MSGITSAQAGLDRLSGLSNSTGQLPQAVIDSIKESANEIRSGQFEKAESKSILCYTFGWRIHFLPSFSSANASNVAPHRTFGRPDSSSGDVFPWAMNLSTSFKKDIAGLDQKVKGRVLEALLKLAAAPTTPNGDTVKPLAGDSKGLWRIRIGDYRLIYLPTTPPPVVCLLTCGARGDVYD
jgi:mRNA interferase RelE/StbE